MTHLGSDLTPTTVHLYEPYVEPDLTGQKNFDRFGTCNLGAKFKNRHFYQKESERKFLLGSIGDISTKKTREFQSDRSTRYFGTARQSWPKIAKMV